MEQIKQAADMIQQKNQELDQKGQELAQMQQAMEKTANQLKADKAILDSIKSDVTSNQKVLQAERLRLKAELELIGRDIVDKVEEILQGQVPPQVSADVEQIILNAQNQIDGPHISDL